MTFDAREDADLGGAPLQLFDFWRQSVHWCYTTADRPITWQNQVYVPAAISMDPIQATPEIRQHTRTIEAPGSIPVAQQFRLSPPSDPVYLRVWGMHFGDADAEVEWTGRVTQGKWSGSKVSMSADPIYASFRVLGLRLRWCRQCPYALYGIGCGVDPEAHKVEATLTAATGVTLQAVAFQSLPDGRLAGGYIAWSNADGIVDRRTIEAHTGSSITIDAGGPDFAAGLRVNAYPGCNKTTTDCAYFNNLPNSGAAPDIPDESPTDGTIVF